MTSTSSINGFRGDYRFLSNFWPCPILSMNIEFTSVEHAYQASKTLRFGERIRIRNCATPGQAKRLGRHVVLRPDWLNIRLEIMSSLVHQKFVVLPRMNNEYEYLSRWLLNTGDHLLIEDNNWNDTFYGMCRGIGENHLGRILMSVRDDLRRLVDS